MYYRAYLQCSYSEKPGWGDCGDWEFFNINPDEWLKKMQHPQISFRIKYLHIISEDDFKNKRVYTKPIEQIIFH